MWEVMVLRAIKLSKNKFYVVVKCYGIDKEICRYDLNRNSNRLCEYVNDKIMKLAPIFGVSQNESDLNENYVQL